MKYSRDDILTVAFYNVENLFDIVNDPNTNDDKYTPGGSFNWTVKRYFKKLQKISYVISQIGKKHSSESPVLVGLAEVENVNVLSDLVAQKHLHNCGYRYVHFESKDKRGIDTALLYRDRFFEPVATESIQFNFLNEQGEFDHTRDILLVSGFLNNELVHVIVNHWPSRREGELESREKRIKAANVVKEVIEQIRQKDLDAKIIILGDFNDTPKSLSLQILLKNSDLFNPMSTLEKSGLGTLNFNKEWYLFDQIILSENFKTKGAKHQFLRTEIFNKDWLTIPKGKYKGTPSRTYVGPWYKGGFSDHFPVFINLLKN